MPVQIINSPEKTFSKQDDNEINALPQGTGDKELDKVIELAGYSYDLKQDIFFSNMDPWQRNVGYCRLYDEAAAPLGMIVDIEPIYFQHQGKKWMIGLWKGQYDLVTGCEIGVYTGALDLNIPGVFSGIFYQSVSNADRLQMSYTLKKNGRVLFTREGKHWWLTGFKLGEFSEPSELEMTITITLNNVEMRNAFVSGLSNAGFLENNLSIHENSVSFIFDTPCTPQPITRTPATDSIIQRKNKFLCDTYQEITGKHDNLPDKLKALEEQAPELYEMILKMGKNKYLYELTIAGSMLGALVLSHLSNRKEKRSGTSYK